MASSVRWFFVSWLSRCLGSGLPTVEMARGTHCEVCEAEEAGGDAGEAKEGVLHRRCVI
jgi:hypothetical protein